MFIEPQKLYAYMSAEFKLKKSTNGWWEFKCPLCNELSESRKAAVNFTYTFVKCWKCGFKDHAIPFVMQYEDKDYSETMRLLRSMDGSHFSMTKLIDESEHTTETSAVELPEGYQNILLGRGVLGDRARKYLTGRGFDLHELDRIGVGYCNKQAEKDECNFFGYIIVPFKSKGKLVYYLGRDYTGNFLRYKNPPTQLFNVGKGDLFFNEDALTLYGEVFITEGWADAATMGRNGISSQGWSFSRTQYNKLVNAGADRLVFVPDLGNGETEPVDFYYRKAIEVAMDLVDYKEVAVIDLSPYKHLGKDINAIGRDKVHELYKSTKLLTYQSALNILLT